MQERCGGSHNQQETDLRYKVRDAKLPGDRECGTRVVGRIGEREV